MPTTSSSVTAASELSAESIEDIADCKYIDVEGFWEDGLRVGEPGRPKHVGPHVIEPRTVAGKRPRCDSGARRRPDTLRSLGRAADRRDTGTPVGASPSL